MADIQDQTSPYLQELDPSPEDDQIQDLEYADDSKNLSDLESTQWKNESSQTHKLGLGGHSWEYWCTSEKGS